MISFYHILRIHILFLMFKLILFPMARLSQHPPNFIYACHLKSVRLITHAASFGHAILNVYTWYRSLCIKLEIIMFQFAHALFIRDVTS